MNAQFDELTKSLAQEVTGRVALKKCGLGLAGMAVSVLLAECPASAQSPALSILRPSPAMVRLSWPDNFTDWHLFTTTSLAPPQDWEPVTNAPQPQAAALFVDYPIAGTSRFFRVEQISEACLFHATPAQIQPGGSSILTWCPLAGTTYRLSSGSGFGPVIVTGSSYVVSPSDTTPYVLTASNAFGITTYFTIVTVTSGGGCDFTSVRSWDCTINFSYELTPSGADLNFMIRQEAHLIFHLTRAGNGTLSSEQYLSLTDPTGNVQVNDRSEAVPPTYDPPQVQTIIGSGAPYGSTAYLIIDCATHTYSFSVSASVLAEHAYDDISFPTASGVGGINVDHRALPSSLGALSGSEFLSARGPDWTDGGDYYLPGSTISWGMFQEGVVNDSTAGSASVNWSFTPNP